MNSRIMITPSEKQCLLDLIKKYPAVASISTNHLQLGEKKNAWAKLTDDFNSIADNQKRTQAQLKKCWDNLKTKRKMELCEEKRSRLKTGGGRMSPSVSNEHHPIDGMLDLATDIELSFCNDSDRSICNSYDDTAASTSAVFSMPWADQSTEVPVFDLTRTPEENSTPQLKTKTRRIILKKDITKTPEECSTPQIETKTRRIIPKKDLIPSSGQVRDEVQVRCLRSTNLTKYDEEIHLVRLETAREQRETARQQKEAAREQRETAQEIAREQRENAREQRETAQEIAREQRETAQEIAREQRENAREQRETAQEIAREQRETAQEIAREQLIGARLQNELLELKMKKAKAELERVLANNLE